VARLVFAVLTWPGSPGVSMKCWSFVLALFVSSCALAQEASPVFHGSWTATVGPTQVLRGTWSGGTSPKSQNVARGSWTLSSDAGDVLLEGTWSAEKTGQGWRGVWTARTLNGPSLSGTWNADLPGFGGKTIENMLERTAAKEVAGWWRSGHYQGNWWLKSSAPQGRSR
jgi:hypothetical protein